MSPIISRVNGPTVWATSLERKRRAGGAAPGIYEDAANFWDFGDGNSYNDIATKAGANTMNFAHNTDEMDLNNTTKGGPPGWTSAGYIQNSTSNGVDHMRTADDDIPDWSGIFTWEFCFLIDYNPSSNAAMPWCVGNATDQKIYSWLQYWNASVNMIGDTAISTGDGFGQRIGEGNAGTGFGPVQNTWMCWRLDFNGTNFAMEAYEKDGGNWSQKGSTETFAWNPQTAGTSPANSVDGCIMLDGGQLNEWSSYSRGGLYIAWIGNWEGESRRGETPITARE